MVEEGGELGRGEEGLLGEKVPEEDQRVPGFGNLYRFIYAQPDAALALILQLLDVLEKKGLLTEEETGEVLKEGIERWRKAE